MKAAHYHHILSTLLPGEIYHALRDESAINSASGRSTIHHAVRGESFAAFWLALLHMPNGETMEIIP